MIKSGTLSVDPTYRFAKATLAGLQSGTEYTLQIENLSGTILGDAGWVKTRPAERSAFKLGFVSCGERTRNHPIYNTIWNNNPDMLAFLYLGDRGYFDITANSVGAYHQLDDEIFSQSNQAALYRRPVMFSWSDHDMSGGSGTSGSPSLPAARTWYRSRVPTRPTLAGATDPLDYSFVPMPGVEVFMTDARSGRSTGQFISAEQEARLIARMQAVGASADGILVFNSESAWIGADGATDTWGLVAAQRLRIANAANAHLPGRFFVIAGDMHALAYDDGTNAVGGFPVFHAAPLGRATSTKGGPYSSGTPVRVTEQQYGTLEFAPITGGWTVTYKGWSVDDAGVQTQRLTHTATLTAP